MRIAFNNKVKTTPGFCSMTRPGVFLLPPGWDASPSQGYPPSPHRLNSPAPINTPRWGRGTLRVKSLAQEHNTVSPAWTRTRTARSGDERTNHEATAPLNYILNLYCEKLKQYWEIFYLSKRLLESCTSRNKIKAKIQNRTEQILTHLKLFVLRRVHCWDKMSCLSILLASHGCRSVSIEN